jgi:hypothetical protein
MWDGKGYHNVHAHTTGTGETAAKKAVYYRSKAACRREREFPVATDGGALSTAIGDHIMP